MNKKLLSLAVLASLVLGLGGVAQAASSARTPLNQRGEEPHPFYGGYDSTRIATATEYVVCSGKCLLGGLYTGTGPSTTRILIFDTAIAGTGANARRLVAIPFDPNATASVTNRIDRPIRFYNGISVDLTAASTGEEVEILYLKLE